MTACDELESRTKAYGYVAQAICRYCYPSVIRADNAELFKRMVYNILVSNDDDHLRNHGFMWDSRLPGWRLSPLYDVLLRGEPHHQAISAPGRAHGARVAGLLRRLRDAGDGNREGYAGVPALGRSVYGVAAQGVTLTR